MQQIISKMADHAVFIACPDEQDTPDEAWICRDKVLDWYDAAHAFSLERLAPASGKCLVVGSPVFEALALQKAGWQVTYVDIRQPPPQIDNWVEADAIDLPFPDDSFDAVSCTCVLCHVGLGRYGDKEMKDGDRKALKEIGRVMKPGAKASVMFGPAVPSLASTIVFGRVHRIYQPLDAMFMLQETCLKALWAGLWFKDHWVSQYEVDEMMKEHKAHLLAGKKDLIDYCYLSMLLEK